MPANLTSLPIEVQRQVIEYVIYDESLSLSDSSGEPATSAHNLLTHSCYNLIPFAINKSTRSLALLVAHRGRRKIDMTICDCLLDPTDGSDFEETSSLCRRCDLIDSQIARTLQAEATLLKIGIDCGLRCGSQQRAKISFFATRWTELVLSWYLWKISIHTQIHAVSSVKAPSTVTIELNPAHLVEATSFLEIISPFTKFYDHCKIGTDEQIAEATTLGDEADQARKASESEYVLGRLLHMLENRIPADIPIEQALPFISGAWSTVIAYTNVILHQAELENRTEICHYRFLFQAVCTWSLSKSLLRLSARPGRQQHWLLRPLTIVTPGEEEHSPCRIDDNIDNVICDLFLESSAGQVMRIGPTVSVMKFWLESLSQLCLALCRVGLISDGPMTSSEMVLKTYANLLFEEPPRKPRPQDFRQRMGYNPHPDVFYQMQDCCWRTLLAKHFYAAAYKFVGGASKLPGRIISLTTNTFLERYRRITYELPGVFHDAIGFCPVHLTQELYEPILVGETPLELLDAAFSTIRESLIVDAGGSTGRSVPLLDWEVL